jgi:RNA polymerase sigma-70 factor (ECF subfamily)
MHRVRMQEHRMETTADRLEAAYRTDGPRLWRSVLAYSGDVEIASDAVAEAFAQALARGEHVRNPVSWVWRVAFLVAGDELRRRREVSSYPVDTSYSDPDPIPDLVRALSSLSPHQRLAVVLHDYADRPTTEIAALIGSSTATVHVHLSKGRRRLRSILEEGT